MSINPGLVLFLIVFVLIAGRFLFKAMKFGGMKAAMFGAPIESTVGEVAGAGSGIMSVAVKVHRLDGGAQKTVGLELVAKSVASYQMLPITLSAADAKKLIQLLDAATTGTPSTGQPN